MANSYKGQDWSTGLLTPSPAALKGGGYKKEKKGGIKFHLHPPSAEENISQFWLPPHHYQTLHSLYSGNVPLVKKLCEVSLCTGKKKSKLLETLNFVSVKHLFQRVQVSLKSWMAASTWHQFSIIITVPRTRTAAVCSPAYTALSAPCFLYHAASLSTALNETKCGSPNYLFTSGVKIKPADRGSLQICNPELQFVYFAKGLPAPPGS